MANVIQIKRSSVTTIPASLAEGELAYSEETGTKLLYIGTNSGAGIEVIGGKAVYDHSISTHAPSNAQKNSDITKAEIEAMLVGEISSHTHSAASAFFNKLDGSTAPIASDDSNDGYEAGSFWLDIVHDESYRCVSPAVDNAVWVKSSLTADELSALAISGNADDLADGTINKVFLATERTKLTAIAPAATANSSDATLLNRANHSGSQLASTISNFTSSVNALIAGAGHLDADSTLDGGSF